MPAAVFHSHSYIGNDITNSYLKLDTSNKETFLSSHVSAAESLEIQSLWDQGYNGTDVVIAVIDTGIDFSHPALQGKNFTGKSFVSPEYGYSSTIGADDEFGHGTSVASLIAGNDRPTFSGMAFEAMLVNAKVYEASTEIITSAALIAALDWAASINEVSVISISMGEPESGAGLDVLELAVKRAVQAGKVVVASAGNNGENAFTLEPHSMGSPGSSPDAITVGSVDFSNHIAYFTSNGPTLGWEVKPDVVAPGVGLSKANLHWQSQNDYNSGSGTSFSTPLISGVAGVLTSVLKQEKLEFTPGRIKAAITDSTTDLGYPWEMQGNGLVNASKAYELVISSNVASVYPTQIPHSSKVTLPAGERLISPVTAVSSTLGPWILDSISGNASSFTQVEFGSISDYTTIFPIQITPGLTTDPGMYQAIISLISPDGNGKSVTLEITVQPPATYTMLIDLVHSPWDSILHSSNKLRVERMLGIDLHRFATLASNLGIWVDEYLQGDLSSDLLNKYDIVWMPSAFSDMPSEYDHELERDTKLTSDELFSLQEFVQNGGHLIVDFGGTSVTRDNQIPDKASLQSLLSVFGLEVTNIQEDRTEIGSQTFNSSPVGVIPLNTVGGNANISNGIPITGFGSTISSVGYIEMEGRVFIINSRNWRDDKRMKDITTDGASAFANAVFEWLLSEEGINQVEFTKVGCDTEVKGRIIDHEGFKIQDLFIDIKSPNSNIQTSPIEVVGDGIFTFTLVNFSEGEVSLDLQYKEETIRMSKNLDFDEPIIIFNTNAIRINDVWEWEFSISDDKEIPKYNIRVLANGKPVDYNLTPDSNTFNVQLSTSDFTPDIDTLEIEVIDYDGNYVKISSADAIMTTDDSACFSTSESSKKSNSPYFEISIFSTSFITYFFLIKRKRPIK
jgi:hypothetical protein